MMIYEQITEKPFNPQTLNDIITFFYCCVLSATPDVSFEEFIDYLDENPKSIEDFNIYISKVIEASILKEKKATEKENQ